MSILGRVPGRLTSGLVAAGLCAVVLVSRTEAATCAEEAELFAQQYGLSGASHAESPSGSAESQRGTGPQGTRLSASKRAKMEALLNAARAAEQQRKSAECFQHLSRARAIPEPG